MVIARRRRDMEAEAPIPGQRGLEEILKIVQSTSAANFLRFHFVRIFLHHRWP